MNEQEIRENKPDSTASHYFKYANKIYYLNFVDGTWLVWCSYDSSCGWGIANQTVVNENLDKVRPL